MTQHHQETLLDAALRELALLYDDGRGLPETLAAACSCTMADLKRGDETPDLIQIVVASADDGRLHRMVCPGWRLVDQLVRLRRCRTFH